MKTEKELIKENNYKALYEVVEYDENNLDDEESYITSYIVEYVDEIQHIGLGSDGFGGERRFKSLENATRFYDNLDRPTEYWGVFDSDGFRWE